MYCVNCGAEIKEDNRFCPICGKKVEYRDSDSEKRTEQSENPVQIVEEEKFDRADLEQEEDMVLSPQQMIDVGAEDDSKTNSVNLPEKKKKQGMGEGILILVIICLIGVLVAVAKHGEDANHRKSKLQTAYQSQPVGENNQTDRDKKSGQKEKSSDSDKDEKTKSQDTADNKESENTEKETKKEKVIKTKETYEDGKYTYEKFNDHGDKIYKEEPAYTDENGEYHEEDIREYNYEYDENWRAIRFEQYWNGELYDTDELTYDENGNRIGEYIIWWPSTEIEDIQKATYEYDENNHLILETSWYYNDTLDWWKYYWEEHEWTDSGEEKSVKHYNCDGKLEWIAEKIFNEEDYTIARYKTVIDEDTGEAVTAEAWEYKYDDAGTHISTSCTINEDGVITNREYKREYDENGNCIACYTEEKKENIVKNFYNYSEYDDEGNMLSTIEYDDSGNVVYSENITYY